MWNRIAVAPGQALDLGDVTGGVLLLNPPAEIAGQVSFYNMQCRVWHLLREPGPDTGYPVPTTGDYPQSVVQRDLNIALGQFISATGLAPTVSDRMATVPVLPVLDFPLPPDLQSLTRVEYTPAGQQTYTLQSKSFGEFDAYWQDETLSMGQPFCYRQPWAGFIRLFPQPGPGQAFGPGIGTVTFFGTPAPGDTVHLTITNNPAGPIILPGYNVLPADTLESIAQNVANLVNNSNAVVGPAPFLQFAEASANQFQMTAINPPGTNISFQVVTAGAGFSATPIGVAYFQPNGDTMTFYYSSTGKMMAFQGDTPGIPPQFHMALVYGVLADYWCRKQDPDGLSKKFFDRYMLAVNEAKRLEWDADRATQPSLAGYYDTDLDTASGTFM